LRSRQKKRLARLPSVLMAAVWEAMESNSVRVKLADIKGLEGVDKRLLGLTVYAQAEPVQNASAGYIEFTLEIANEGNNQLEILNPIDFIQYMILNELGFPIKTPPVAPRLLIDEREWGNLDLVYQKFAVVSITEDGLERDISGEILKKVISIGPDSSYAIILQINRIIDESRSAPDNITSIPPGQYKMVLTFSLATPGGSQEGGRLLKSEEIPVELTYQGASPSTT
jgi:hypothetical protein